MFLIPCGHDAPVYHWPYATVGIIGLNSALYLLSLLAPEMTDGLIMQFGTLTPVQWFTSVFMHANLCHLVGNMIFLWVFASIVEGKIGWLPFLLVYLGAGAGGSILEQIIMLGRSGGSLGASGAIMGMLMISLIWAPENNVDFKFVFVVIFYPIFFDFQLSVLITAFLFLGLDFFNAALIQFSMSTEMCHLLGALSGGAFGYWMLVSRRVDCEGYDIISMQRGRLGETPEKTIYEERAIQERAQRKRKLRKSRAAQGIQKIDEYLNQGHYEIAWQRFHLVLKDAPKFVLPEDSTLKIIQGLNTHQKHDVAREAMKYYVTHFKSRRALVYLALAKRSILSEELPKSGLSYLRQIDTNELSKEHQIVFSKLARKAKQLITNGVLEVQITEQIVPTNTRNPHRKSSGN